MCSLKIACLDFLNNEVSVHNEKKKGIWYKFFGDRRVMKKALFQRDEACLLVRFQMCKEEVVKQESAFRLQFVLDKYQVAFREITFPPVKDAV